MGFEQRGHWQNEESCLVFLDAINSKQLEEGSGGSGFSLSVHQHFGSEGFCCSTEPLLFTFTFGVCVTECKRSRERLVAVADRCQHNLLKCMKGQGWHLEAQLGDSELVIPKWNSVLRKTCSKFDHFTRGNSALTQTLI